MNATQLLAHFDRLAEAPDAVPRLRALVLDLAVRGKLLAPVRGVEAVSPAYSSEPMNGEFPRNWRQLNFGRYFDIQGGTQPPKSNFIGEPRQGYVRLFQIRDLGEKPVPTYISTSGNIRYCESGEILVGRYGASVGKVFWAQDGAYNVAMAKVIYPLAAYISQFVYLLLKSSFFQRPLSKVSRSAQAGFNKGDLGAIMFPLPPLAEQHRIVSKVDELMALCDQLEAAQQERERRRDRLASASLQRLNQPAEANPATDQAEAAEARQQAQREQQKDHARFHLQNLHRLTTRPEHIKAMREVVLDAAFQGTLTPQNVCDGDGIELLERVVQHSLKGVVTAKVKSAKSATAIGVEVTPAFPTPRTWTWAPLQLMCEQIGDIDHKMPRAVDIGVPFLSARDLKDGGLLDFLNPKYISEEDFARLSRKVLPRRNDIVYSRIGARLGKARLVEVDTRFLISYSCCLIRPKHEFIDKRYLQIFLDSHLALQQAHFGVQSIGVPDLGLGEIKAYRIPLPPLAEQHRIVAKVDELMALCEQLEAQLTQSQTDSRRLLEAVLEAALA